MEMICVEGHTGVLCGICKEGYRQGIDKLCVPCDMNDDSAISIYIVPIIFVLLIASVSGVYYYVNCNDEETIEDQFKNWLDDFTLFDKKEEGKIDYHTFYQLLRFINIKISEEEVTNLVKVIDINNDKYIDKQEYLLLMCKIKFSDGGSDYIKEIITKSQQYLKPENEIIETKSPVATSESEKETAIGDDMERDGDDNDNNANVHENDM